jgi:beta-galactosidase/beta-glucuronidase
MRYRYRGTQYDIVVRQTPPGADTGLRRTTVTVDDVVQSDGSIRLADDGQVHQVRIDVNGSEDKERLRLAYVGQRTDRTGTAA